MMGFDTYAVSPWRGVTGATMMVLFWGGLILLLVWDIRAAGGFRSINADSALEVLRTRLATGDITQDEYEKTRRILQV